MKPLHFLEHALVVFILAALASILLLYLLGWRIDIIHPIEHPTPQFYHGQLTGGIS